MARRHSSRDDFQIVGMDSDPTPGDPDQILSVAQRYQEVADAAERALNVLRRDGAISQGRGSAMDQLKEMIGDTLPDKLARTRDSYQDAARAYKEYVPRLQEAQETFDRAVDRARDAAPQAALTPRRLGENPTDEELGEARRTQSAIEEGTAGLNAAKSLAEQAKSMREAAQRACADVLDQAASEAIPERNIFQKITDFFKDFPFVQIVLGLLIAAVAVFFPVVGALLGGALFTITQVSAIASGNFSLGEFATGLLGVIPGGSLLRAGGVAVTTGAGAIGKLAPGVVRAVDESVTGVAATIRSSRTVGAVFTTTGGRIGTEAAAQFVEGAGSQVASSVLDGEELDLGVIALAGVGGAVVGGAAAGIPRRGAVRSGASRGPGPVQTTGPGISRSLPNRTTGPGASRPLPTPPRRGVPRFEEPSTSPNPPVLPAGTPPVSLAPSVNPLTITGIPATRTNPDGVPQFRSDSNPLFRDDTRDPRIIFQTGFVPRNPANTDLLDFVETNTPSAFVSTTRREELNFLGNQGGVVFRFRIRAPGGVDVNETLGDASPLPFQAEVAFPGGINPRFIEGAQPVTAGLLPFSPVTVGDFIPNPNFRPGPDAPTTAAVPAPAAPGDASSSPAPGSDTPPRPSGRPVRTHVPPPPAPEPGAALPPPPAPTRRPFRTFAPPPAGPEPGAPLPPPPPPR